MSINQFVEMTVFLCLICFFSIYDKMQGFLDESGLFIYFLAFYAEIQNGHQKWLENDFWEKSKVDSADNLRVKNFVEIALSRSISKINGFLRFTQKFKMATKSGRKTIFVKKTPVDSADTLWIKNFVEIALSHSISKINTFFCFTQKFKMAAKSGGKTIFAKTHQ